MDKTKYCQDPRGRHKKRIFSNVRKVTEHISQSTKGLLKVGSLLCCNCIQDIKKDPDKFISVLIAHKPLNESLDDTASASSVCTSSTDVENPEMIKAKAETILSLSDVSPIKTGKKLDIL